MTEAQFKPSEVLLTGVPLAGTMGKAFAEYAATMIVRTCQVEGDTWQAVTPQMIGKVVKDDLEAKREPLHSLRHNPVFRPDFYELVKRGFARWVEKEGGPLELTPDVIAALDRWVQR